MHLKISFSLGKKRKGIIYLSLFISIILPYISRWVLFLDDFGRYFNSELVSAIHAITSSLQNKPLFLFSSDKVCGLKELQRLCSSDFMDSQRLTVWKLNLSKEGIFPVPEISITKTNAELMRNVSSMCSVWQTLQVISRKHVMFINTIWLVLS